MIVNTRELFKHAYGKYAVGAYNINNLEQTMGLFRGCLESQAPFMIQISKGARSYTDKRMLEAMIRMADQIFPDAIFAVHLDHGDEEACLDCIQSGFYSSVMIDASMKSYEENIAITKRIVAAAHKKNIVVEAELGQLGGVEEQSPSPKTRATLPIRSKPRISSSVPGATAWPAPSARATAPTSLPARRACTSRSSRPSRNFCRASRW